jgi:hypothetical protein
LSVTNVAWRAQPPDEASDEPIRDSEDKDAEVVDLTHQRLLGWLKGMFGGEKKQPPPDES